MVSGDRPGSGGEELLRKAHASRAREVSEARLALAEAVDVLARELGHARREAMEQRARADRAERDAAEQRARARALFRYSALVRRLARRLRRGLR